MPLTNLREVNHSVSQTLRTSPRIKPPKVKGGAHPQHRPFKGQINFESTAAVLRSRPVTDVYYSRSHPPKIPADLEQRLSFNDSGCG